MCFELLSSQLAQSEQRADSGLGGRAPPTRALTLAAAPIPAAVAADHAPPASAAEPAVASTVQPRIPRDPTEHANSRRQRVSISLDNVAGFPEERCGLLVGQVELHVGSRANWSMMTS